ncbi:hypothetical protein PT2222_50331 [Paraburkholderia tropica]
MGDARHPHPGAETTDAHPPRHGRARTRARRVDRHRRVAGDARRPRAARAVSTTRLSAPSTGQKAWPRPDAPVCARSWRRGGRGRVPG